MTDFVFLNGDYLERDQARISPFDRGFLFADGVYEVIPVINAKLVDVAPFQQRLKNSLAELSIQWPTATLKNFGEDVDSQALAILNQLVSRNQLQEGGVYLQITRGANFVRDFAFQDGLTPTMFAFSFEKQIVDSPFAESGVDVVTTEDIRWQRRDIKSIALLAQCMAKNTAVQHNAFEGWMVEDGFITEGTSSSAYIVKNNTLITRPLSQKILPGIRRKALLQLASEHNVRIEERPFTLDEALDADEALLSSATTLVLPITSINGNTIGDGAPGPIYQRLRELYLQHIN